MMPGIATAFADRRLLVARPAGDGGVRRRVPDVPRRVGVGALRGGCFPAVIGAFLTSIYVLRVVRADLLGPEERRSALPGPARRAGHRVGRARHPRRHPRALRRRAVARRRADRHGDGAAADADGRDAMSGRPEPHGTARPRGRARRPDLRRAARSGCSARPCRIGAPGGCRSSALSACRSGRSSLQPGGDAVRRRFVVDPLALFAQRLFLVSAAVSVLATLGLPGERFARRGAEYHVALLASLLGHARARVGARARSCCSSRSS